jgi:hypothetical protein
MILYNFRNESDDCDADFIYEEDQTLKCFARKKEMITDEILTSWYTDRVRQIENRSCMVEHAVTLTKLARERNIVVSSELSHVQPADKHIRNGPSLLFLFVIIC